MLYTCCKTIRAWKEITHKPEIRAGESQEESSGGSWQEKPGSKKGNPPGYKRGQQEDFEEIEVTGSKRDTITRDVGEKAKKQRDFEGIEQKMRDAKASRDFEGIEQLRNAKDVRDFEGIEQKLRNSKDIRDFEGIEQLRNAKDVRDFEGIEQKLRGAKVLRDFEGIEQRTQDKMKKKRGEEAQKGIFTSFRPSLTYVDCSPLMNVVGHRTVIFTHKITPLVTHCCIHVNVTC